MACLAKPLQREFSTLCIDLYGFGATAHPNYPLTITDYAIAVVGLLNELQIKDVILAGHSFGGRIALYIAANYGFLVKKLILIDSAGLLPKHGIRHFIRKFNYKFRKAFKLSIDRCGSPNYKELNGNFKKTFVNVVNFDQQHMLQNITCKTLIIWGKLDKETPLYMAKQLNKSIVNSKLVILNNCGHFVYLDCYHNVLHKICMFLGGDND